MDEKKFNSVGNDIDEKIKELSRAISKYNEDIAAKEAALSVTESIAVDSFKKRIVAMVLAMVVMIAGLAGSSLAYFTVNVGSSGNIIATSTAEFEQVDLVYPAGLPEGIPTESLSSPLSAFPGEQVRRSISAVNTGELSLYVRAKVETFITLSDRYADRAGEINTALVIYDISDTYWKTRDEFDGYYYFNSALAAGAKTPDFINSIIFSNDMDNIYKGATVKVKVTFEIVQANENGATVFDAVGWPDISEVGGDS